MQSFTYTLRTEHGIHARPAGLLVNEARTHPCTITLRLGEKTADAKRLIAVMGLGAKQGDSLTFEIEGEGEENCRTALEEFCGTHL